MGRSAGVAGWIRPSPGVSSGLDSRDEMAPSAAPLAVKSETAVPGMAPRAERIVCAVMAVLFSFSAAVQYNDPDPIRWAAIYLAAMAVCIGYVARPMPALPAVLVAVASLGWALIWA